MSARLALGVFLVGSACGLVAEPLGPFTPDANTVALYHFDEPSGEVALDSGPQANHGKVIGARRVAGVFGGAIRLDGKDDHVVVADHPSLRELKQITVEAWIRTAGEGGRQFICGKDCEWHFDLTEESGAIGLSLYSHAGRQHTRTGTGGFYFRPFQWTHVAATYDGKKVKFFQDGALVRTASGPDGYLLTSAQPLLIGTYQCTRYFFAGAIDELRVSDCVRYDPKDVAREKQQVFSPVLPSASLCKVEVRERKKKGKWRIEASIASQGEGKVSGMVFFKPGDRTAVPVGKWEVQTEKGSRREVTESFDVSDEVVGTGDYCVIFRATDGGRPVRVGAVSLVGEGRRVESKAPSRVICSRQDMDAAFDVSLGETLPVTSGDIYRLAKDFDFCGGKIGLLEEDNDSRCSLVTGQGAVVYYIRFPKDGAYDIYLKYAAKQRSPLDATLDDADINRFDPFANTATGGVFLKDAVWEHQGTCVTTAGVHALALSGYFPSTGAVLVRPTDRQILVSLGPERGARPCGDLLAGEWKCERMIGNTENSSAAIGTDSTLTIRYRFGNVDPQEAGGDDVLLVRKRVFWDLSAVGQVRFRLEGDGAGHLLRLRVVDGKGDSRLLGQARLAERGAQEIQWPVTFEGDAICDGTSIAALVVELHEASAPAPKVSQGEVRISEMQMVFRDELVSVPPKKVIAPPAGEKPAPLCATGRSVCVAPVVPEDYPTFASANPKPVTRKTLGYSMHATGARGLDAATLDNFHKIYQFGDVTWPYVGFLFQPKWQEKVRDAVSRKLFLFDLWGYVPGDRGELEGKAEYKVTDEIHRWMQETCGELFLGYDNGEQDGRYIGSYAGASQAKTRREAFEDFDRWDAKIRKNQQNFLVSTGSLNFCHYYGHFGCILLGLETAQGLPSDSLLFAFLRGACKQYGRLWHQGISVWSRYGYKTYDSRVVERPDGYGHGPTKGASASLMKRLWYVGYLGGCSIAGTEMAQFTARTLPDGRKELSPIGRMDVEGVQWVAKHPDRGEQYTPVAAMLDFYHGWNMPRHLYRSDRYKIWGKFDYEKCDYQIDNFFRMVLPGYEDCSYFRNGRGFLCETPYGDVCDVLVSTAPEHVLDRYDAIVMLGGVKLEGDLLKRITSWVSRGGDLFVCTAQTGDAGEMFLGINKTGKVAKATAVLSLADSTVSDDQPYRYDVVALGAAKALAVSEAQDPIVTVNSVGEGRVVCITADYGMTDEIRYRRPDLVNMEPKFRLLKGVERILGEYLRSLALVEVKPTEGIQVITNLTSDRRRLLVGLVNNDEAHDWAGEFRPVRSEAARVTEWVEETTVRPAPWIEAKIPAGEFRIYEIKTREDCVPPIRKIKTK